MVRLGHRAVRPAERSFSLFAFLLLFCSMNTNRHRKKNTCGGRRSFGWVINGPLTPPVQKVLRRRQVSPLRRKIVVRRANCGL